MTELADVNIRNIELLERNPELTEYLGIGARRLRTNKHNADATIYNGRRYPSKWQATKAAELDLEVRAGLIKGYIEDVPFRLPGLNDFGQPYEHLVDFGVLNNDNTVTWIERKGQDIKMGKMKRRQVEQLYKIVIKVED